MTARPRRSRLLFAFAILVLTAGILVAARSWWLGAIVRAMIDDEGPAKADVALVLAGDWSGLRLGRAVALLREGDVPKIMLSGPRVFYGIPESDLALSWAARQGLPLEWFIPVPNYCLSTADEARLFYSEMEKRNFHSFLLVTTDIHTGRAARLFRKEARARRSPVRMRVVAAYNPGASPENWWRSREGQKSVFFEAVKNVTSRLGI